VRWRRNTWVTLSDQVWSGNLHVAVLPFEVDEVALRIRLDDGDGCLAASQEALQRGDALSRGVNAVLWLPAERRHQRKNLRVMDQREVSAVTANSPVR
jgi:hypothetical protein